MKRTARHICLLVGVLLSLAVVSVQAQTATQYRGHIPFAFNVGQETFKAGDYVIALANPHSDQRTLLIRSAAGDFARLVMTLPKAPDARREAARLVFNCYGEHRFLVEMTTPTLGAKFRKGDAERRNNRVPRRETVGLLSH